MKNKALKISSDFEFAEGPLWHPDGFLLVSDTGANCIKQVHPNGDTNIFLDASGGEAMPNSNPEKPGSNGLAWKTPGKELLICRQGSHSIALYNNQEVEVLTSEYRGIAYNSPNDIIIDSKGTIYFTDPPYGLKGEALLPTIRQKYAGVYKLKQGEVTLLFTGLKFPNGLCLSPDEQTLYVSSNHPDEPFIYKTAIDDPTSSFHVFSQTNADGMLGDALGNIYTASGDQIYKFNSKGKLIENFDIGDGTTNLTWGGPKMNDLYITTYQAVWKIKGLLS